MTIKGYSAFPKASALLKSHHQIVLCHIRTLIGGVLPLCRNTVGIFCSPSWVTNLWLVWNIIWYTGIRTHESCLGIIRWSWSQSLSIIYIYIYYYCLLSIVSDNDFLLIHFLFIFLTGFANFLKGCSWPLEFFDDVWYLVYLFYVLLH